MRRRSARACGATGRAGLQRCARRGPRRVSRTPAEQLQLPSRRLQQTHRQAHRQAHRAAGQVPGLLHRRRRGGRRWAGLEGPRSRRCHEGRCQARRRRHPNHCLQHRRHCWERPWRGCAARGTSREASGQCSRGARACSRRGNRWARRLDHPRQKRHTHCACGTHPQRCRKRSTPRWPGRRGETVSDREAHSCTRRT